MIGEELLIIITKEITGQSSEDEKDVLSDWLCESQENSRLYHSYKEAYLNGKYKPKARNKDEVFDALSRRLPYKKDRFEIRVDNKLIRHYNKTLTWRSVAAILLILITSSIIVYETKDLWNPANDEDKISHEIVLKSNPQGVKSLITLPDGSKVKLNSESHLEYYSDFEHVRSVNLIGEAFFEIVRDSLRPFYVNTGDLRIRVLGTSFNVEAFPFEKSINVALVTGKILIEKKEGLQMKPMEYLDPEDMLTYDHQTTEYEVTGFDKERVIGWKDGVLHFDQADLNTVMETLERWYGVEIIVSPTADLTGEINDVKYDNTTLDVMLDGIGFMNDFDYEIKGKKVYIK